MMKLQAVLALLGCGAGKGSQIVWQGGAGGGDGVRLRRTSVECEPHCCLLPHSSLQAIGPSHTTLAGGMTLLALPLPPQCFHVPPTCMVM